MVMLYRLGVRVLPRLPRPLLLWACALLAWPVLACAPAVRRAVSANSRIFAPSLGTWRRLGLMHELVANVLRHYVDLLRLKAIAPAELQDWIELSGTEQLDALVRAGRGGLMVVPHTGPWSAVLAALAGRGYPMTLVVEAIEPPELLELISELRAAHGIEVLPLSQAAGRETLRAIRAGRLVVLAADRDLASTALMVPFFGVPAPIPAGPAALAARGIPTFVAYCAWTGGGKALGRVDPCILPPTPDADRAARFAQEFVARFEAIIRLFPASWGVLQPIWEHQSTHTQQSDQKEPA